MTSLKFRESERCEVAVYHKPNVQGEAIVTTKLGEKGVDLFQIPQEDYEALLMEARSSAHLLQSKLNVKRCALVSDPSPVLPAHARLAPLHGLNDEWKPVLAVEEEFSETYPGYISSKNGPKWDNAKLDEIKTKIKSHGPQTPENYAFHGESSDNNLFARLVRNEVEQWRIWEDDDHVAFLTPFPSTPGFTVLVPRKHLSSDVFALDTDEYRKIITAAREVANLLKQSLRAQHCGMIFEGYEIDYTHVKLIPIFCSDLKSAKVKASCKMDFNEEYRGYVSSLDGPKASAAMLEKTCSLLTE